jgi:hypothetical protein
MHYHYLTPYSMPVSSNVNKLWQSFTGKTKPNPVNVVAQRFLKVFHDHGLQAAQIPRLLPQIKLDDLKSEEALLAALTPDVLDQFAHLFGIRTAWIEGVDDGIYDCLSCYKQPEIFFENLALLNRGENDSDDFFVQTFVTTKQLDMNDPSQQLLAVVVAEKIAELGDQRVYRYHVYGDGWDWGYWPTRIQLKAIARLLFKKFGKTMPIYTTKLADLENIREGRLIPRSYLGRCVLSEPSLEDYAMTQEENFHAKEIAELPEVLEYIEEHNLENHIALQLAHATPPIDLAPVQGNFSKPTAPASVPPKSGKRAINDEEVWNPVESIVQAWWSENDSLLIGDAVKRIQLMPHLKASNKSSSTIHKRIAKFAPPKVRGKSGRKPK